MYTCRQEDSIGIHCIAMNCSHMYNRCTSLRLLNSVSTAGVVYFGSYKTLINTYILKGDITDSPHVV